MKHSQTNRATISEQFFAALCAKHYLKGFVFHSPKRKLSAGEGEAGDVLLWVRDILVVFEIIWKNTEISAQTKRFVRRIGTKRDQLVEDYRSYKQEDLEITMKNENGESMAFDHQYFTHKAFCGVVIIDSDLQLEKLHFDTVRKSLDCDFPIAIMRSLDFMDLLLEVDTPADLLYYLADRKRFLRKVFKHDAHIFLDMNTRFERELVGFYKLNNNSFPVEMWTASSDKKFWTKYQTAFAQRIRLRDEENESSFVVDEIIELVRNQNRPGLPTLQHSWELGTLARRARAGMMARKIIRGFEQMNEGRKERHFALHNQATECWILFYFHFGLDSTYFRQRALELAKMKVQVERVQKNFPHSVFCYAFRKSPLLTSNTFDECLLVVDDAKKYPVVSEEDYLIASKYFLGGQDPVPILEFPA